MINRENERVILDAEEHAPKRLRRPDVAALRNLFAVAATKVPNGWKTWRGDVTVFLSRDRREMALARLSGHETPRVFLYAKWSKRHEMGLDVLVQAYAVGGAFRPRNLLIGEHRFRLGSTETQFTREVSHLVRLGLGWSKKHSGLTRSGSDAQ